MNDHRPHKGFLQMTVDGTGETPGCFMQALNCGCAQCSYLWQ